ncbi:MAG: sugar nucleotide-binding protein [Proteobacteria bacterium]|nr:sugar nucleotide-binding protein [Pseudomonadota bacterium]
MVGSAMVRRLPRAGLEVVALDRARYDILNDPIEAVPLAGVDAVVNCAGLINRFEKSRDAAEFYQINSIFPRRLADACARAGLCLIHISTDCVFDGATGLYDETAAAVPKDLYGRAKLYGEAANAMVLRTSVIGPERAHFHSLLCWFLGVTDACQGYTNHWWSGMTTVTLSDAVGHLIVAGRCQPGLFHLHGEDITKHDLLRLMAQAFGKQVAITPAAAAMARDMRLRTRHPELLGGFVIPTLSAQLRDLAALCDARGRWHAAAAMAAP